MAERKPLYQPWNEEEFQSDIHVRKMNNRQRWVFRTLLQAMFFHTTRPYLPKDDDLLWMLADCQDREEWEAYKNPVLRMFYTQEVDGQEMWANKRVMEDWSRLMEKREALKEIGRKGGLAKAKRVSAEVNLELSEDKASEVKRREVTTLSSRLAGATPSRSLDEYADKVI